MALRPVSDVMVGRLPECDEVPDAVHRSKMVAVRQLQSTGLADSEVEVALGITLAAADRMECQIGQPDKLLLSLSWERPTRRGREASEVPGVLEVRVNGQRVLGGASAEFPCKIYPEKLLAVFGQRWAEILLKETAEREPRVGNDRDAPGDEDRGGGGVRLDKGFQLLAPGGLVVRREGAAMILSAEGRESAVGFQDATTTFEKFGNLLCDRLSDGDDLAPAAQLWLGRDRVDPVEALSIAAGRPAPAVLRNLQERLTKLGERFDLERLRFNPLELVAATRMVATRLPDREIIELLNSIDAIPRSLASASLASATSAATAEMIRHSSRKPYEQGYALAGWFRGYLGLQDPRLAVNPAKVLDDWNVPVIERTLISNIDALAVWGSAHGPALIVNRSGRHSHSQSGKRATLAHEICHILFDRGSALPLVEILGGDIGQKVEARAGAFAAEFLVPRAAARSIIVNSPDVLSALDEVMDIYEVGAQLAAWQLINSGARIEPEEKDHLFKIARGG